MTMVLIFGNMWKLLGIFLVLYEVNSFDISDLSKLTIDHIDSYDVSEDCSKVLKALVSKNGDKSVFAKMIDAMSKPSGIFKGNIRDYGNFDECIEIEETINEVEVLGKYCHAGLLVKMNNVPVRISTCIPHVCEQKDIFKHMTVNENLCQTKRSNTDFDAGDWTMSIVLILILIIICASTIYDLLDKNGKEPRSQLLIAFSAYTNGQNLLKTSNHPDLIHSLNGLRFISMLWVIAGHRFISSLAYPMINFTDALEFQQSFEAFYIQGARVAVDTFFFMSAFLSSYMYFKKVEKKPLTYKQLPIYYLHRFLRITPAVAAMYFMHLTLIRRIGSGPIWIMIMEKTSATCSKWWWSFFLYLQNYVNYDDMCIVPTWYLSADMQMFLVAPFLILPLGSLIRKGKKKVAIITCINVIGMCIIIPMIIDFFRENKNEYETHTRLSVYVIGIFMGMLMPELKEKKMPITRLANILYWTVSLVVMFLIIMCTQDVRTNVTYLKTNLFHSFTRPIWSLGLCWIVYSCTMGSGGFINWLLSRPIFQILGKLCYCMYLLHNPIITISIASAKNGVYFSNYNVIYYWCGDFIFTLIMSLIWYLVFESPMIVVEKVIFGKGGSQIKGTESTLPPKTVE